MRLALRARPAVVPRDRAPANGSEAAEERGAAWRPTRRVIGRAILRLSARAHRAYALTILGYPYVVPSADHDGSYE